VVKAKDSGRNEKKGLTGEARKGNFSTHNGLFSVPAPPLHTRGRRGFFFASRTLPVNSSAIGSAALAGGIQDVFG
jgi:hypothetical protein